MTSARGSTSAAPAVGMLIGMLLLGFAGVVVIMESTTVGQQLTGTDSSRRLQVAFGYITTSKAPSSFDSSDSSSLGSSLEPSKSSESGSFQSSEWGNVWPKLVRGLGGTVGGLTGTLLIQVIFAVLFYRAVTAPIVSSGTLDERMMSGADSGASDFQNSIFGCLNDPWVCIQGLCCPMVRMAHTNAASGVCPFWESLWCWCCCAWLTLNFGPCCLLMWWRLRLKQIMRVDDNPVNDFCITLVCPQISICQMSSAVDYAMNYQTTGCCEYTPWHTGYGSKLDTMG